MIAARAIHSADVEGDSAYDEVACTACTGKLMSAMEARSIFECCQFKRSRALFIQMHRLDTLNICQNHHLT